MANSRHYRNNQQIEEPRNWQDLEVNVDWANDKIDATINLDALEFAGQTAIDIIARLEGALNGGVGYWEGDKYRVEVGDPQSTPYVFNGYLDYTQQPIIKDCNIIEVALKREQGTDWLNEVADSFSYRYLASDSYAGSGKITGSDYKKVPYVINYIPDGMQLLLLSVSLFSVTKEIIATVQSIAEQTSTLIDAVVPNTGTAGPIPATTFDTGAIIAMVLNLAVSLAYAVALTFAAVELIEQIVEQLLPRLRLHLGMTLKSLFVKGCEYLNLELKSSLLDSLDVNNQWVIIPSKGHKGGEAPTGADASTWREVGFPTSIDGLDTFGDVIRTFKRVFNADYRLKDGVFEFERRDFWQNQSTFIIPSTFTNQDARRNEYTVNSDELKANYFIKWEVDTQDQNTLDNQNGRVYQIVTSPNYVSNPELINTKGLTEVSVPFSMGTRKNELTAVEEALKVLLEAADFLTGQLGEPQSFTSLLLNRLGSLHLSSHFINRPKMVVMTGTKLSKLQRENMAAQRLWGDYHYIESFVTINGSNNQQYIYSEQTIPFCFENFVSLLDNNFVETEEGEKAEIVNLNWSVEKDRATITYRVYRVYDNNLKQTFLL